MWEFLGIFFSCAAGGAVAGACIYAIGGLGVDRTINRRLDVLEGESDHLSARLTQEVKRRASVMGNSERQVKKDLQVEAMERLAQKRNGGGSGVDPMFDD